MSCARCKELYRADPDRPDCNSANPQYDGQCPRRGIKYDPISSRFMFLAGLFLEYKTLPISGGLYDQDVRFVTAIVVMGSDAKIKEMKGIEEALRKIRL